MFDLRYQVISFVAIFLALGIGILMGTTLVERGLISEQKGQIESLQKTFAEIKDKNSLLNDELNVYEDYSEQTTVYMLSGRLQNRSYAVLAKQDPDENAIGNIQESIAAAGGLVPASITIAPYVMFKDKKVQEGLAALFGMHADPAALRDRVYLELRTQITTASNPAILDSIAKIGVIKVRGSLQGPVTGTILLGAVEEKEVSDSDIPLINTFITGSASIIGVGGANTPEPVIVEYKKTGISTVDNVDTVVGGVSMVLVLEGRGGNFGREGSADRLVPMPQ